MVAAQRRRRRHIHASVRDCRHTCRAAVITHQIQVAASGDGQFADPEVHVARYCQEPPAVEAGRGEVEVEVGAGARDRRARADRGLGADVHVYRPEIEAGSRGDAGDGVAAINLEVHPRAGGTDQRQGI